MTRFQSIAAPIGQCVQVIVSGAFVSALGLLVTNPFKEATGLSSSCHTEQTPATLVVNGQASPNCTLALSVLE